jgi:fructosamine-3-kinase
MYAAEAAGLDELRQAQAVRVPAVRGLGVSGASAWLALEWLRLDSAASADAALGEQLALQHRRTAPVFGWHRDNTIGSTPQVNTRSDRWVEFFRERRLRYQLDLAARNGHDARLQQRLALLLERMSGFFTDYQPVASLLHGDLWGGNWATASDGRPVIFDPAVYYGDREADLAMTRLFGGFGPDFYAAYASAWPPDAGAAERADLYNLYHVLNHLNLFGAGYVSQVRALTETLLARLA